MTSSARAIVLPEDSLDLRENTPEVRRVWMRVLRRCPDKRLSFLRQVSTALEQLRATDAALTLTIGDWCLEVATLSGDPEQIGLAQRCRAWGCHWLNRFDEAFDHYEASAAALTQAGNRMESARTRIGEIWVLRYFGRYQEAIALAEAARPVLLEHGRIRDAAVLDMNLASVYRRMGGTRDALALSRRAASTFEQINQEVLQATALMNAANALTELDELAEALAVYQQSAGIYLRVGEPARASALYTNLGELYYKTGRFDEGLRSLSKALRVAGNASAEREAAFAHLGLSQTYGDLNLLNEAIDHNRAALDFFRQQSMPWESATTLLEAAGLRGRQGRANEARDLALTASEMFRAQDNVSYAAISDVLAASTLLRTDPGRCAEALEQCREAIGVLQQAGWHAREGSADIIAGDLYSALGDQAMAESAYLTASRIGEEYSVPGLTLWGNVRLGQVLRDSDPATALEHYLRAQRQLEGTRTQFSGREFRQGFTADKSEIFQGLVLAYLNRDTPEATESAFLAAEQGKSRALLDDLRVTNKPRAGRKSALLNRLRERLEWYYSRLDAPNLPVEDVRSLTEQAKLVEAELADAERQQESIESSSGVTAGKVYSLQEVRALLGENDLLLEYYVAEDEIMCFEVSPDGLRLHRSIADSQWLGNLIDQLHFQMGTMAYASAIPPQAVAALERSQITLLGLLYDALLSPIEDRWRGKRLVVVPHGALHSLPFHALWDGERYVIDDSEVSYAPSASVLAMLRGLPKGMLEQPLFVAPESADLPAVEEEVNALKDRFPSGTALMGAQASLAGLKRTVRDADVLHLATHAVFRKDNPAFSGFRMTRSWLLLRDVPALRMKAWLAVLSACETGQVDAQANEELVGLSHAFFLAGCRSLVASLWAVDDQSTADMMKAFYERLASGSDVAESLRGAQLQLRGSHPSPYHWAPFVALGSC